MSVENIRKSDTFSFEAECRLWGQEVSFGIELEERESLETYLPAIEEKLAWLEEHRRTVEQALIEDDMVSLAEDWASGAEEGEEENCYIMEDGQKVYLPISEQDFCKSLRIESFTVYCDEGIENMWIDMFLICSPDYFAYHAINVAVNGDGSVECNSLAG